jgi:hypothetical protein
MKVTLKMLLVGLAVVVSLSAGPAWSQERGPANMLDLTKGLNLHVDKVLEGSEEIKPGEDTGEPTPRGIYGVLIVANYGGGLLYISRGSKCNNPLGIVPPYSIIPMPVGDWQGDTKLCAKVPGESSVWRQTVTGSHFTWRWNIWSNKRP